MRQLGDVDATEQSECAQTSPALDEILQPKRRTGAQQDLAANQVFVRAPVAHHQDVVHDGLRSFPDVEQQIDSRAIGSDDRGRHHLNSCVAPIQVFEQNRVTIAGKPDLNGSADPAFRGDAAVHNPEDHFLAAISGCHMLSYLALCAREGVNVIAYADNARGIIHLSGGSGAFEQVTLHPVVTIEDPGQSSLATALHDRAAECCFIANSCRVRIEHRPVVHVAGASLESDNV